MHTVLHGTGAAAHADRQRPRSSFSSHVRRANVRVCRNDPSPTFASKTTTRCVMCPERARCSVFSPRCLPRAGLARAGQCGQGGRSRPKPQSAGGRHPLNEAHVEMPNLKARAPRFHSAGSPVTYLAGPHRKASWGAESWTRARARLWARTCLIGLTAGPTAAGAGCIYSVNLYLIIGEFSPFTPNVLMGMKGLKRAAFLFFVFCSF